MFVTRVVLFELFRLLRIDVQDNGFDRHVIYRLLKGLLIPVDFVVLLEVEDLTTLGVVLDF